MLSCSSAWTTGSGPGGDETLGAILGMIAEQRLHLPKRQIVPHSALRRTG